MDASSRNHMNTRRAVFQTSREPSTGHGGTPLIRTARDAGFAMPIVVFALVLLGIIGAAALQSSRDELLSAEAVSHSNQAFYAAEAGIHSAASSWDQVAMDTLMASPGDSLLGSWTTIENRCSYQLVYRRIDGGDTSAKLYSVESTGRSPGLNGGRRRIAIIMKGGVVGVSAAVAFDTDLVISGNPEITGLCGSVHTNGDLLLSGNPIIAGDLSATGTVVGGGVPTDTLGSTFTPTSGAPAAPVPDLSSADYCGGADFVFSSTGFGLKVSTSEVFDFGFGDTHWGWKWNSGDNFYQTDAVPVDSGTYCIDGNVGMGNNLGAPGAPQVLTLLTTGSIEVSGNSYLMPAHPDSILMIADGDLKLNGNPTGGYDTFEGLIYGGAQCEVGGNPVFHGQLLCKNNADPTGSRDIVQENKLNGNMKLTYMCGGIFAGAANASPISGRMWSHVW